MNGTPPSDLLRADPYDPAAYSTIHHFYAEHTDRETLTFGFNDTIGGSCHTPMSEFVYFGIRCIHPLGISPGPCEYNLTVTALPHYLRNGMQFDGYLKPIDPLATSDENDAIRHYFKVQLTSYEMLQIDVHRNGNGRQLHDANGLPLGLGLAGAVYMQRVSPDACPVNGSANLLQVCEIGLNDTKPCTLGHPCSNPTDPTDDLVLMIEAVVGQRPVTFIDVPNSPYEEGCLPETLCSYVPNLVDRFGQRPDFSSIPGALDRMPRYNLPKYYIPINTEWHLQLNNKNELRPDRGVYTMQVTQLQYEEGTMVNGEMRPGCVSYGQWRRFGILTTSARDASVLVHALAHSGRGLGGVYVRMHQPPTELTYDAMTARGSQWSSPQRVAASPCLLNRSTYWHIALMLEEESVATSRGVPPTQFTLSLNLEDALLEATQSPSNAKGLVLPRGGDNGNSSWWNGNPARGQTGDGFACCGVFKYFLVPNVPAHLSLRADLIVSNGGEARAVFLKSRTCPTYPDDVLNDVCLGKCSVSWLTRFDAYDGTPTSAEQTSLTVPNGLGDGCPAACPADLRENSDWYVGVLALPGTEVDFRLQVRYVEPPHVDRGHQCDPSAPECRPPYGERTLGSPASAGRRLESMATAAYTLLACAIAVVLGMGRDERFAV